MEFITQSLKWWWVNKPALASFVLVLASVLTMAFPVFAQRRQPKLSLAQVTQRYPRLRWLLWGSPLVSGGSWLVMALSIVYLRIERPPLGDEQGLFLLAVLFCIPSLSAGVMALCTGIYREIVVRGEPGGKYFCVAGTRLTWVPWAQSVAALTVGGVSLAGFFAMAAP